MSSALSTLLEMGFSQQRAERALVVTGNQDVEAAMEWLLAHSDEPELEPPAEPQAVLHLEGSGTGVTISLPQPIAEAEPEVDKMEDDQEEQIVQQDDEISPDMQMAKSLRCDDCGKLFKLELEVEYHAAKSGHQNFSESSEEVKPLTEEEKKEKLRQLEEKIKERRMMKEEATRKDEISKEKLRRRTGQEMVEAKKKLDEEEIRRIAEQKRKEKIEEKMARKKILEQIERDKQARKEKFGMVSSKPPEPEPQPLPQPQPVLNVEKKEYDQSKIQIRLTNGQTLVQTFGSKEELAAIRLFIEMNRTDGSGPFELMTTFPKKVFKEEDMEKPLYELGLVPSAVIIVTRSIS